MVVASSLGVGGCADCGEASVQKAPSPAFATLMEPRGVVGVRHRNTWFRGESGTRLDVKGAIRTGPESDVRVAFREGAQLKLGPSTLLELAQVSEGVVLQISEGEVEIHLEGGSLSFHVPVGPEGRRLTFNLGRLRIRRDDDVLSANVVEGEVQVETARGIEITRQGESVSFRVGEGSTIAADPVPPVVSPGAVDPVPDVKAADPPELPPVLALTLHDPSRRSRVRRNGEKRLRRVQQAETAIEVGDVVESGRSRETRLGLEGGDGIALKGRARLGILGTRAGGSYRLERGSILARVGRGRRTEIVWKGVRLQVEATGHQGVTEVVREKGKTQIKVLAGRATISAGEETYELLPGQRLHLDKKGRTTGPAAVRSTPLKAREGRTTRIYYDRRPERIQLVFSDADRLEVAADPHFTKLHLQESVGQAGFTLEIAHLKGPIYWRVSRGEVTGASGVVHVGRDGTLGRRSQAVSNVIHDSGWETRVLFQGKLPALNFRFKASPQAQAYRLKVFRAANLATPLVTKEATGPSVKLRGGRLKEGVYFWYQVPLNSAGKELVASQMNKLTLAFDNATPLLRIDRPVSGQRASGVTAVSGVVAKGLRLRVNGKAVMHAPDGRFSGRVNVGAARLLRFTLGGRGRDTIFLRHMR